MRSKRGMRGLAKRDGMPLLRGVLVSLLPWCPDPDDERYIYRDAQIECLCPYCGTRLYHGWRLGDGGDVQSHRVAHCPDGCPLHERGYYISVARQADAAAKAHIVPPTKPIRRLRPKGVRRCS